MSAGDAPLVVRWFRYDGMELKQSSKYTKIKNGNDFILKINQLKVQEDSGEYIIKAENAFGYREEIIKINVEGNTETEKAILIFFRHNSLIKYPCRIKT